MSSRPRPSCANGSLRLWDDGLVGIGRFLVPARHPGAARYLADSLFVAHNLRERCARWLALRTRHAPSVTRLLRAGSTKAPSSGSHAKEALDVLGDALEAMPGEFGRKPPFDAPDRLRPLVRRELSGGRQGRFVVFLFEPGNRRPSSVLKLRRRGAGGALIAHEADALERIAARLGPVMRPTVPQAQLYWSSELVEALLIEPVAGRSAYVEMQGALAPWRRVSAHFRAAAAWLSRLHLTTRVEGGRFDTGEAQEVLAALGVCREAGLQTDWHDELATLCSESPLPLAASHGDFWPGNLHLADGGGDAALPALLDWEAFRDPAPPFKDLFHFPLSYGLNYPWSRYRRRHAEEAFRLTFIEATPVSLAVRGYLADYCQNTGLDSRLLRPLLMLYLLGHHAQGEAQGTLESAIRMARILETEGAAGLHGVDGTA